MIELARLSSRVGSEEYLLVASLRGGITSLGKMREPIHKPIVGHGSVIAIDVQLDLRGILQVNAKGVNLGTLL